MIQQEHLTKYPNPEKLGGKSITYPDLGVDIKQALQQYARGSLENRAIGYYMEQGMEVPDLHMMDKIQKLEMLSQWRKDVKNKTSLLDDIVKDREKKAKEKQLDNLINQKANEKIKSAGKSGDTGKD